jgi:hypothetical protein
MVNGPCPFNQRLIYRFRTDSWMGMLNRTSDDVNSIFYILKDNILEYISGLIEGEGYFPLEDDVPSNTDKFLVTTYMATNTTPRTLYELIYNMVKKLSLYRKMARDPGFRNTIMNRVKNKRMKDQKRQVKNGELSV